MDKAELMDFIGLDSPEKFDLCVKMSKEALQKESRAEVIKVLESYADAVPLRQLLFSISRIEHYKSKGITNPDYGTFESNKNCICG